MVAFSVKIMLWSKCTWCFNRYHFVDLFDFFVVMSIRLDVMIEINWYQSFLPCNIHNQEFVIHTFWLQAPKYFDSGDYNMAKAKMGNKVGKPVVINQKLIMPDEEVTGMVYWIRYQLMLLVSDWNCWTYFTYDIYRICISILPMLCCCNFIFFSNTKLYFVQFWIKGSKMPSVLWCDVKHWQNLFWQYINSPVKIAPPNLWHATLSLSSTKRVTI